MHIKGFDLQISTNKSNLSLKLIKKPFLKKYKKWFLTHKKMG